jgi:hypothetical protein
LIDAVQVHLDGALGDLPLGDFLVAAAIGDGFIRSARQLQPPSTVRVGNPVMFETEEIR